jgi:hypothetical protein
VRHKTKTTRAARKGSSSRKLKIGDRVRIIDISSDLKGANHDLKDAEHREMRTAELFRFCLGREFTIRDFDRYGNAELRVEEDPAVRTKFGKSHWIWVEPEYLERIKLSRVKVKRKREAN